MRQQQRTALIVFALVCMPAAVFGDAKEEHAKMKKEHAAAHADHDKWEAEHSRWRADHLRALAALAKLQARILEHEALLEEHAQHIRAHEDHAHHHAEEIVHILRSIDGCLRFGPAPDQLGDPIPLTPGMTLHIPELEWHVFEYGPGGQVDIIFFYGQVDRIRPEEIE